MDIQKLNDLFEWCTEIIMNGNADADIFEYLDDDYVIIQNMANRKQYRITNDILENADIDGHTITIVCTEEGKDVMENIRLSFYKVVKNAVILDDIDNFEIK